MTTARQQAGRRPKAAAPPAEPVPPFAPKVGAKVGQPRPGFGLRGDELVGPFTVMAVASGWVLMRRPGEDPVAAYGADLRPWIGGR